MKSLARALYSGAAIVGRVTVFLTCVFLTIVIIGSNILLYTRENVTIDDREPTEKDKAYFTTLSVLLLIIFWGAFYLVYRFKFFAAFEGANALLI